MEVRYHTSKETLHPDSAHLPTRAGAFEDHGSLFSKTSGRKTTRTRNGISDPDTNSRNGDEMDHLSQKSQGDEKFIVEKKQTEISRSHYDPEVVATRPRAVRKPRFTKTKAEENKLSSLPPSSPEMKMGPKYYREKCSGRHIGRNDTVPLKSNNSLKHISATNQLSCAPSEFPLSSPISKIATGSSRPTSPSSSSSSDASLASPSPHNPYSSSVYSSTIVSSKHGPRVQQSFPPLSPLSSPIHKRSKVVATKSVPVILSRKDGNPRKFPGLSPNKFKPVSKLSKEKGKRKADVLAPFPMSTRDSSSIFPSEGESTDNVRKRKLQIVDEASAMVSNMDLCNEQDSFFMSPSVDPSSLCPYCDSPLPPSPTCFFLDLLRSALSKSHSDPRSTNPLGRKAPLSTFAAVCQRHDFESKVLPEAEAKGWPKTINWEGLGDRVSRMKPDLEGIIWDSGETDFHIWIEGEKSEGEDLMTTFAFKGPRIRCVFWREAMKSFFKNGVRAMVDVRGQFQNFKKSQPGYYGELGHIIIQQTLFNMFPPDSFDLELINPFSANDFIQRVLVPEVALRLIMEDRRLKGPAGAEAALLILRESATYGVTMFPEDSGESMNASSRGRKDSKTDVIGVGDRIVMERAMKRRREIESGEIEALLGVVKEGRTLDERKKGRGMKHTIEEASDDPWSQDLEREQKLPHKPLKKVRKIPGTDDDDVISVDSKTGSDSEKRRCMDGLEAISGHAKRIDYDEDSDNKNSKSQHSGRSLSKSGNRSSLQNGPSVQSKWTPHRPLREAAGLKAKPQEISDIDLCSTDDDTDSRQGIYKSKAMKSLAVKFQRSRDKPKMQSSNVVVDLDPMTPLPKCHSAVSTPESKQLALAKARAPTAGSTNGEAGKPRKSGPKKTIRNEWHHNTRASASVLPMSCCSTSSSNPDSQMKKSEDTSGFDWLLDD